MVVASSVSAACIVVIVKNVVRLYYRIILGLITGITINRSIFLFAAVLLRLRVLRVLRQLFVLECVHIMADSTPALVIFNSGNKRRIRPADIWTGAPGGSMGRPRNFSYHSIRAMTRLPFRETPRSRAASLAGGAGKQMGTGW